MDKKICVDCIQEPYLREILGWNMTKLDCDYCGKLHYTYAITKLADWVEQAFEDHYQVTRGTTLVRSPGGESFFVQAGDPVIDVIEQAAKVPRNAAEDLQELLHERHSDFELAKMGEQTPFDAELHYEERGATNLMYFDLWHALEKSLKEESRFFNDYARGRLREIFDGLEPGSATELRQDELGQRSPVIVKAGPGCDIERLYRARVFEDEEQLKQALIQPDRELGPPPPTKTTAGRMNAAGIAVFYGSLSAEAAVAEVRPPVGSDVVVAQFDITRELRLLDLFALEKAAVGGSVFDTMFKSRLERASFLRHWSRLITHPVLPGDESSEYIATQSVADYLAQVYKPRLDGIIFHSAQCADDVRNVVLFHHAARVEPMPVQEGEVQTESWVDDDGPFSDFRVYVEDAQQEPEAAADFTLRVDPTSLVVHLVRGVTVQSDAHPVERAPKPDLSGDTF